MNPDIKAKWIARLRSGQDRQGHGQLNADGKLCCLGVLCEIAVEDGIGIERHSGTYKNTGYAYGNDDPEFQILPTSVQQWAGLRWGNPEFRNFPGADHTVTLAGLNDQGLPFGAPFTFAQIADVIEEYL